MLLQAHELVVSQPKDEAATVARIRSAFGEKEIVDVCSRGKDLKDYYFS